MKSLTFGLIAIVIVAALPAMAGQAELQADPSWTKVADGVFERIDDQGVLHRTALGLEGLRWDIARTEQLLDNVATDQNLTKEQRLEQLKALGDHLLQLHRIEAAGVDSVLEPTEKLVCVPSTHVTLAQTTPYSGAGIFGTYTKAWFDGTNCPGLTADGAVFAYANGEATGVMTDSDIVFDSNNFDIIAHAMGIYSICTYGSAALVYGSTYQSNHYEVPANCYCSNCS